jgi:hypothetical protein
MFHVPDCKLHRKWSTYDCAAEPAFEVSELEYDGGLGG